MQIWDIATDRAQRVDEKNGVIRLVVFTPRLTVIKMSKMACFMYFLLDTAKNQSQNSERYLTASKWSYLALSEKNSITSSMCTYIAQTLTNVLLLSAENTKN